MSALIPAAECPILLDADALNCLRGRLSLLAQTQRVPVLTPHPGEMARLAEMTVSQVTENALAVARLFAKEHRSVVVLKGHRTLVASPAGREQRQTSDLRRRSFYLLFDSRDTKLILPNSISHTYFHTKFEFVNLITKAVSLFSDVYLSIRNLRSSA